MSERLFGDLLMTHFGNQLELDTLIKHEPPKPQEETHKPSGIRLAKMLGQYEESPSSQLWSDIQRLAREILK
jgi:hypothetical protein